jgi:hypothetical protein
MRCGPYNIGWGGHASIGAKTHTISVLKYNYYSDYQNLPSKFA